MSLSIYLHLSVFIFYNVPEHFLMTSGNISISSYVLVSLCWIVYANLPYIIYFTVFCHQFYTIRYYIHFNCITIIYYVNTAIICGLVSFIWKYP